VYVSVLLSNFVLPSFSILGVLNYGKTGVLHLKRTRESVKEKKKPSQHNVLAREAGAAHLLVVHRREWKACVQSGRLLL
jgi:hypothetical protein